MRHRLPVRAAGALACTLAGAAAAGGGVTTAPAWTSVLRPATLEAQAIQEIAWVLLAGAALIFAGVMLLLVRAVRRGARPVSAWAWVVGGGVAFPVATLSALLLYDVVRSAELTRPAPADALVVSVTGRMWWWEVRYVDPASGRRIVTANEVRVPVGRPVRLALDSADVIHSLWVPSLHGKADMVPGRITHLVFTATRPGVYRGQCAEFCGTQHARMALHVVAEPPAAFDAWLARQAEPARAPADARLAAGQRAFVEHRCGACHTVRGVVEGGRLAPDLTHVGGRLHIGAGVLPTHEGTIAAWIAGVQAHKPGARMPEFAHLDPRTREALAAWLAQLE